MATITLPPELERVLTEQARLQGTTLETLVLDWLNASFLPTLPAEGNSEGETMADFLVLSITIDHRKHTENAPSGKALQSVSYLDAPILPLL